MAGPDDDVREREPVTAAIPAADIAVAGTAQVTVVNPDGGLSNALPFTTTSPSTSCPCSIWPSTATPAVASNNDPTSLEVGVRFQSDSAGYIKGIRFYKGASNTGPHTGKLWTASGTLLASATFSGETASGWQEVRFATPVAIAASTTYVASYYTAAGFYSVTRPYFTSQVSSPPLRALADGDGGGNGLYRYGAGGGFPTSTSNSTNYWVDVVFDYNAGSGSGPTLTALAPSSAAAGGPGFTLTVTGTNFVSGASVRWNGGSRPTTFVSASQLTAAIPAADIAGAGTAQVTVVNPDTSVSNALPFTTNAASTAVLSSAAATGVNADNGTVALPAGTQAGDALLVIANWNDGPTTVDLLTSGFTKILTNQVYAQGGGIMSIFTKRLTAADLGPVTAKASTTATRWTLIALTIRNPHPTQLIDVAPVVTTGTGSSSAPAPTITTQSRTPSISSSPRLTVRPTRSRRCQQAIRPYSPEDSKPRGWPGG